MDDNSRYGTVVPVCRVDGHRQCTDDSLTHVVTVEKEDFDVDNRLPVSFYRIDVRSCSVRGQVSVCHGCRHK